MIYIIPLVISGHTFQNAIYDLFLSFSFPVTDLKRRAGGSELRGREKQAVWPRTEDGWWNGGGEGERCRR